MLLATQWVDPGESERNIRWTRHLWHAVQPFARNGGYVNYLDVSEEERIRAAYGEATYDCLVSLEGRYDPEILFRANQNVSPELTGA